MSISVLVIPEDPQQNGHILKPLVQAIMGDIGRPHAKVNLLTRPRVRGYDQAVMTLRNELNARYGFMDLWLFFPDADRATSDAMQDLEEHVEAKGITLLCCAAHPEVGDIRLRCVPQRYPGSMGGCPPAPTHEGGGFRHSAEKIR